jgi:MOSC domain-containing protein YiiM
MNASLDFADAAVMSVSMSESHSFSKYPKENITLLEGLGVEGDAHCGKNVQHLSRIAKDPRRPNLRQVHLIHAELFDELAESGFSLSPGLLGENITTRNVPLLHLPTGTRLIIARSVVVEITGLRNPCSQIDDFMPGLLAAVLRKDSKGNLDRKCGVMAVVIAGGIVRPGDVIRVELPPEPHIPLHRV